MKRDASRIRRTRTVPHSGARVGEAVAAETGFRAALRRWVWRRLIRAFLLLHQWGVEGLRIIPRKRWRAGEPRRIMLTGSFYADTWILSHVQPLAASKHCREVLLVTTYPAPPVAKVRIIRPPAWLIRVLGAVGARLVTFVAAAAWYRPDVVGGFHLLLNGLAAGVAARLAGGRSMYFCVGGPMEVLHGGFWAENRLFSQLGGSDAVCERRLIAAVLRFDDVVTMGTRAVRFYREKGARNRFHVVSGGIDRSRFRPGLASPTWDVVFIGRLVEVKRVDVLLEALAIVKAKRPGLRAVLVGDGDLRPRLEEQARRLELGESAEFVGHRRDAATYLQGSRVFALTSDTEGLALSIMEAICVGLPVVASDVGDLGDLVKDGVNGFLVERRRPDLFAEALLKLLEDGPLCRQFSESAVEKAERISLEATTWRWDRVLA